MKQEVVEMLAILFGSTIIIENIVQSYKKLICNINIPIGARKAILQLFAIAISVTTMIMFSIDIFLIFGLSYSLYGSVLTGILVSEGSNKLKQLLEKLKMSQDKQPLQDVGVKIDPYYNHIDQVDQINDLPEDLTDESFNDNDEFELLPFEPMEVTKEHVGVVDDGL